MSASLPMVQLPPPLPPPLPCLDEEEGSISITSVWGRLVSRAAAGDNNSPSRLLGRGGDWRVTVAKGGGVWAGLLLLLLADVVAAAVVVPVVVVVAVVVVAVRVVMVAAMGGEAVGENSGRPLLMGTQEGSPFSA